MNRNLLALTLAIVAVPVAEQAANAAIRYDFRQTMHSQIESMPSTDFGGEAIIDGDRSRVEFTSGSAYPPGSYLITTNGSRNMTYVDPTKKSYVEVNAGNVATAIGATNIKVENFKSDSQMLADHPVIAEHATDHYRMQIAYDITLTIGSMPIRQAVTTTIDKWVTKDFDDVTADYLATGGIRTGNPDLDQLIDVETTKVPGFALRQKVQVTTTASVDPKKVDAGSKLQLQRTQITSKEMVISSIRKTIIGPGTFRVPPGYQKANPLRDDSRTPVHELDFKPAGTSGE
ncbi:MAG: hypothetical protein JWO97_3844 [Acidobacteria bacterium]|nr:hypothetical protein [Acidobacteriota bacterium]